MYFQGLKTIIFYVFYGTNLLGLVNEIKKRKNVKKYFLQRRKP